MTKTGLAESQMSFRQKSKHEDGISTPNMSSNFNFIRSSRNNSLLASEFNNPALKFKVIEFSDEEPNIIERLKPKDEKEYQSLKKFQSERALRY